MKSKRHNQIIAKIARRTIKAINTKIITFKTRVKKFIERYYNNKHRHIWYYYAFYENRHNLSGQCRQYYIKKVLRKKLNEFFLKISKKQIIHSFVGIALAITTALTSRTLINADTAFAIIIDENNNRAKGNCNNYVTNNNQFLQQQLKQHIQHFKYECQYQWSLPFVQEKLYYYNRHSIIKVYQYQNKRLDIAEEQESFRLKHLEKIVPQYTNNSYKINNNNNNDINYHSILPKTVLGVLCNLLWLILLLDVPDNTRADWLIDCGDCHCKWNSGKKTADCKNLTLTSIPKNLSNEIQVLDLSFNRILYLEENTFLIADLQNLHKLYIRNSSLQQINPSSFTQLEILIELDLSNNLLRSLSNNLFGKLVKVRAIVLNGNLLEELGYGIFQNLKYLHKIELKNNRLIYVGTKTFINVPLLSQIYLNNNHLSFLRKETFQMLRRLTALSLDGNVWNCTCELQIFRDFVFRRNLYTSPTDCYYPVHLRGMLWIEDQPHAFACRPHIIFPTKGTSINTSKVNVTLLCKVYASSNTRITWDYSKQLYRSDNTIIETSENSRNRVHTQVIRYEGIKDSEFGRDVYISRLTIVGVQKSDEGLYICIAENAGGKDSMQMSLLVGRSSACDLLQGNVVVVISLMALTLLSFSIFLSAITCCIYKRHIGTMLA